MSTESREEGPSERDLRNLETIHEVAVTSLQRQVDHFREIEEKVWRHAALLGVVLGVFAVGLPRVLKFLRSSSGEGVTLFLLLYVGAMGTAAFGILCFIMAMQYEILWVDPVEDDLVKKLGRKSYPRSLVALAKTAVRNYGRNEEPFDRKEFWARLGWWSLPTTLVAVAGSVVLFFVIQT